MMIDKKLLLYCLPFPKHTNFHDWYLAFVALCLQDAVLIPNVILRYRCHEDTVTDKKIKTIEKKPPFFVRIFSFKHFYIKSISSKDTILSFCQEVLQRCKDLPKETMDCVLFAQYFFTHYKNHIKRMKCMPYYFEHVYSTLHPDFSLKQKIRFIFEYLFL